MDMSNEPPLLFNYLKAGQQVVVLHRADLAGLHHRGEAKAERKSLGSYEEWSRLVRDALIWIGEPDPVATMEKVRNEDPKLQTLGEVLNQWFAVAKAESFEEVTVKPLVEVANSTSNTSPDPPIPKYEIKHPDLRDALAAAAGDQRSNINTVTLGRWLSTNKGRVVNGLRVEPSAERAKGGLVRWSVQGPPKGGVVG